jgi:hypothetical protein
MADKLLRGVALGAAAAATAVLLVPSIAEAARPFARRGLKLAILAVLQGREALAHAVEMAEDAYAEARADLKEQAERMAGAAEAGAGKDGNTVEPQSRQA